MGAPLGPLDEPEAARPSPVAEPKGFELDGIAQPIEIHVQHDEIARRIDLEQREGGTADRTRDAERPQEPPCESRLASTELAREIHDGEAAWCASPRTRELPAELLGLLSALGLEVHEGARD